MTKKKGDDDLSARSIFRCASSDIVATSTLPAGGGGRFHMRLQCVASAWPDAYSFSFASMMVDLNFLAGTFRWNRMSSSR